jgi:hypothetical protein
MRHPHLDPHARLQPAGRRWGFGAHSLLPYLSLALHSRPGAAPEAGESIRNPVFPQMEHTLRALRGRH